LRYYYERLVEHEAALRNEETFDAYAWAFARTLVQSTELESLVDHVGFCFLYGIVDLTEGWDPRDNIPDPRLGLQVLELVVRGYRILRGGPGPSDQRSHIDATSEAIEWIENWSPRHIRSALLFVEKDEVASWYGGTMVAARGWLRAHQDLEEAIPDGPFRDLLRSM